MGHVKQFISLRFAHAKYTLQHEIYTGCPRGGSLTRFIAKVFKYMQNRERARDSRGGKRVRRKSRGNLFCMHFSRFLNGARYVADIINRSLQLLLRKIIVLSKSY